MVLIGGPLHLDVCQEVSERDTIRVNQVTLVTPFMLMGLDSLRTVGLKPMRWGDTLAIRHPCYVCSWTTCRHGISLSRQTSLQAPVDIVV